MAYKPRTKSKELIILEILNDRMILDAKYKQHYFNLKKGYEGEMLFDSLTEKLQCECLILNDLLLEVNNTIFQIDSIIITGETIYLYEVKNYEGDYYYESDSLYKKPRLETLNPLHQLIRSKSLLHKLLLNLGFNLPITGSVVFINPNFTLYQAPLDKPIIFPTQVKNHLSKLSKISSKITEKHKNLADQLLSLHITDSPYEKIPPYDYNQLRKGMICPKCHSFSVTVGIKKCICRECGYEELVESSVLKGVKEFKILFPNEKITTILIHDWCQVVQSEKRIRNILLNNFSKVGSKRWTYYE